MLKNIIFTLLGAFIGAIVAALMTLLVSIPVSLIYESSGGSPDERIGGAFLIFYGIWPVLTIIGVIAGSVTGYRLSRKSQSLNNT